MIPQSGYCERDVSILMYMHSRMLEAIGSIVLADITPGMRGQADAWARSPPPLPISHRRFVPVRYP